MKNVSRRKFLIGTAAGAAVVGAGVGATAFVTGPNRSRATQFASTLTSPLTVYVRDASKGEMVLLANNNQIILQDADLAARLLNAAQQ